MNLQYSINDYINLVNTKKLSDQECLDLYTYIQKQKRIPMLIVKICCLVFFLLVSVFVIAYIFFNEPVNDFLWTHDSFGAVIIIVMVSPVVIGLLSLGLTVKYIDLVLAIRKNYPTIIIEYKKKK